MSITDEAIKFLSKIFDFEIESKEWIEVDHLPLFIKNQYQFSIASSNQVEFLIVSDLVQHNYLDYQNTMDLLRNSYWSKNILFVTQSMTPYDLKRCFEKKISFIIPGKQIYAPFLGLLFNPRKDSLYHSNNNQTNDKIAPSTLQVLLEIVSIEGEKLTQTLLIKRTGFSRMTISRAIKELKHLGVIELDANYKAEIKLLNSQLTKSEFLIHLPSPIERKIIVTEASIPSSLKPLLILSGESALSERTILSEPQTPIYAISKKELYPYEKKLEYGLKMEKYMIEIEVWKYRVPTHKSIINKWALYFSLLDQEDERIQSALKSLGMNY